MVGSDGTTMTLLEWINLLYHGAAKPRGFIEFRCINKAAKGRQKAVSRWMPYPLPVGQPDELTMADLPADTHDLYFGVNAQAQMPASEYKAGTDAQAIPAHLCWIDIDLTGTEWFGGMTEQSVLSHDAGELELWAREAYKHYMARLVDADLPPRAVVYSGHGLHFYLAQEMAFTPDSEGRAELVRINRGLAVAFDGDIKSTNASRILRLPNSLNRKNPERPITAQLWYQDADAVVSSEALAAYMEPDPEPLPEPVAPPREVSSDRQRNYALKALYAEADEVRSTPPGNRNNRLNEAAFKCGTLCTQLSEGEVFAELHAAALASGMTEERDGIEATLRSGWRDGKRQPRDMSRVNWHEAPAPKPAAQGKLGGAVIAVADAAPVAGNTPPSSGVYVLDGCYYIDRQVGKNTVPEQLTNWVWTPQLLLRYPDGTFGERGILTVRGTQQHEIQIEALAWNGRRDLLDVIGGYGARCITTNNADIAKIADYIATMTFGLPSARGVKSYGLHAWEGQWIEVYEDATVGDFEHPPLFYAGTPVEPGSRAFAMPPRASEDDVAEARRAIVQLPSLITPAVAYALLGYGAASAYSPRITPHLGNRLPFVYVAGERESGKTSGAQIVLELMTGHTARLSKASGLSAYQYDIAFGNCNNLLALLDEYRPGEIDDGQLRKHHDLGTKWRGQGMAANDLSWDLNAPTVVLGEGFTDDAATKSRGVLYLTRKADRGGLAEYSKLQRLPLAAYATHLHKLARETSEDEHQWRLEAAGLYADEALGGSANPRLRYALQYIAYGLLVLQQDTEGLVADSDIKATLAEGVHQTLEGGSEGMTNLELFLEQLCFSLTRVNNQDAYVVPGAETGTLIIKPSVAVALVKERYKENAAIANVKLFGQYARQVDFFVGSDKHRAENGDSVRGWRIRLQPATGEDGSELPTVPERCDVTTLKELEKGLRK